MPARSAAVLTGACHAIYHVPLLTLTTTYQYAGSRWIVVPMVIVTITWPVSGMAGCGSGSAPFGRSACRGRGTSPSKRLPTFSRWWLAGVATEAVCEECQCGFAVGADATGELGEAVVVGEDALAEVGE